MNFIANFFSEHIFSINNSDKFFLKSVNSFGTKIIYDPLDIWHGNLIELNAKKLQKK